MPSRADESWVPTFQPFLMSAHCGISIKGTPLSETQLPWVLQLPATQKL